MSSTPLAPLSAHDEGKLRSLGIPLCAHVQACLDCPNPCADDADGDRPDYLSPNLLRLWAKQDIDLSPEPLLTIAHPTPFRSHVLISTEGRKDWDREISDRKGSLAQTFEKFAERDKELDSLAQTFEKVAVQDKELDQAQQQQQQQQQQKELPEGIWNNTDTEPPTRVLYQNSSHHSTSSHNTNEADEPNHTILLFPHFQLVTNVPAPTPDGANEEVIRAVWDTYFRGGLSGGGEEEEEEEEEMKRRRRLEVIRKQGVRRWVLPYRAVVLLCSHKKRDARCSIAAALLSSALRSHAEEAGWTVDERNSESSLIGHDSSPPDSWGALPAEGEGEEGKWRRMAAKGEGPDDDGGEGTLGIFHISHIGGHKYSGNVIVYFPTGAGVWYGRVSPVRDTKAVFEKTIRQGIIIPEFLRAGINLVRETAPSSANGSGSSGEAGAQQEQQAGTGTIVSGTRDQLLRQDVPRRSLVQW
ncbi:unnamed protein product [Tilletia controversa]|nr:unnamed protein product [Tilletia controversa]